MAEPKSRTAKRRRTTKAPILDLDATDVTEETEKAPESAAKAEETAAEPAASQSGKSAQPKAAPPPEPQKSGGWALKAAGIAAIFVAGAAAGAWLYRDLAANYAPSAEVAQVASKIAELEGKLVSLQQQGMATAKSVENLTESTALLKESISNADQSADLKKALETAEAAKAAAADISKETETANAAVQAAGARADDALSKIESLTADLAGANKQISELKSAIEAAATANPSGDASDGEALKALQASLSALALKVAEVENNAAAAPAAGTGPNEETQKKLDALTSTIEALKSELATAKAASAEQVSKLANLQNEFATAQDAAKLTESQSELAKALANLRTAVAEGKPFVGPVEVIRTRFPDDEALQSLAAQAATGVPTKTALIASLAEVRQSVVKTLIPESEKPAGSNEGSSSLLSTLQQRLSAIVKVRPAGTRDWAALVEQMEAQAKKGELGEAVGLADSVGEAPPEKLGAWLKSARARVAVDRAIAALSAKAMAELAKTGSTGG